MMQRCYKTYAPNYKWYGGRGIYVAKRWHSFEKFYADMGEPPYGHTLDRKRTNGPYSKKNCRWATRAIQARNTRRNVHVTHNGRTLTVTDWARELNRSPDFVAKRLRRGWTPERAITTA